MADNPQEEETEMLIRSEDELSVRSAAEPTEEEGRIAPAETGDYDEPDDEEE